MTNWFLKFQRRTSSPFKILLMEKWKRLIFLMSLLLWIVVSDQPGPRPTEWTKDYGLRTMDQKKYNRLGKEKSPYLLQHKDNPVNWSKYGLFSFPRRLYFF